MKRNEAHGMSHTSEYSAWSSMKDRCLNKNHHRFHQYGGRGITICDRWVNSFSNFWQDMGAKPAPNCSLERINCDDGYSSENCKWADSKEQNRNRRDYNCLIEYRGKMVTRAELSEITGVNGCTIRDRLATGRTVEEAVYKGRLMPRKKEVTA